MKKKIFQILFIVLFIFISGCEKEKTEYDAFDFDYEATVSNISAFYDLEKTFKETSSGFELDILLNPKMELLAKDLKIRYKYVVEYFKYGTNDYIDSTYDFTVSSSNGEKISKLIKNTSLGISASHLDLYSIKVLEVRGRIYTKQEVDTVNNPEKLNKDNYDKFVLDMEELDKKIQSNYLTVETNVENKYVKGTTVTTNNVNNVVKMRLSPFYMETSLLGEKNILIEEDNSIISFDISPNQKKGLYWVTRTKLGEVSSKDEYYNYEEILGSADLDTDQLDYTKIKIEATSESKYTLSGKYKDFLSEEEFQDLQDLYTALGLTRSILNNAICTITITFEDDITMEIYTAIPVNTEVYDKIENITTVKISVKEFNLVDPYDETTYHIYIPNSFEKVYQYTNILEDVVSIESTQSHFYLVHLEGGQYYFNDYTKYLKLSIYNLDQNRVDLGEFFGQLGNNPFKYYFTIPEGDYYINIVDNGQIGYKFKLEKLNYTDVYDINNPRAIKSGTLDFEIEGNYDMVYANYYSDKSGALKVSNNTDKFSRVIYDDGKTMELVNEVLGDGRFYPINKGDNYFYLHGDTGLYNYTIEFMELDDNKDLIDLVDINDYDSWIITGAKLSGSYFKFDVTERGTYIFNFEVLNTNDSGPQIVIYDINTNKLIGSLIDKEKIILDKGNYYIRAGAYLTSVYKLTYEFEGFANDVENIELKTFPSNNAFDPNFPIYRGYSMTNDQNYVYGKSFTLTETSNVLIYSLMNVYTLYDEDHKKLSLDEFIDVSGGVIYKLKPGKYTIQIKTQQNSYTTYNVKVAIIAEVPEDDHPYDPYNLSELNLGSNSITTNYTNDIDVLKLTVTKEAIYTIYNNYILVIYDENLNIIKRVYSGYLEEVNFKVGTYYFISYPLTSRTKIDYQVNIKQ